MSVLLETSAGDIVIDLLVDEAPKLCENFLKLCALKYYNFAPVHTVLANFTLQTGDPLGPSSSASDGGSCVWGLLPESHARRTGKTFAVELPPKMRHVERGTVSMATAPAPGRAGVEERVAGSQFIITLGEDLSHLDGKAAIFGRVVEGFDALETINDAFCDEKGRPLVDIRIKHTVVLDDPFPELEGLVIPAESPQPTKAQLATVRIGEDEGLEDEGGEEAVEKRRREREARAQALTLEMVGDLPFAEVKPPENVLFVCKLNPVTTDEDLELIFSRFGTILSCEVIRDARTGDSLQYAFVEYETPAACEQAYFKMQGVLIDDHRIHVDFSQSVSRLSESWRTTTNEKRRRGRDGAGGGGGFGGFSGLEKRSQYKRGDGGGAGGGRDGDGRRGGSSARARARERFVYDEAELGRKHATRERDRERDGQGSGQRERHDTRAPREEDEYGRTNAPHRRRSRSRSPRRSRSRSWSLSRDRSRDRNHNSARDRHRRRSVSRSRDRSRSRSESPRRGSRAGAADGDRRSAGHWKGYQHVASGDERYDDRRDRRHR